MPHPELVRDGLPSVPPPRAVPWWPSVNGRNIPEGGGEEVSRLCQPPAPPGRVGAPLLAVPSQVSFWK